MELVVLVLDAREASSRSRETASLLERVRRWVRRDGTLFRLWRSRVDRPRAWARRDLSSRLRDVDRMVCSVRKEGRYAEHFREEDLARLRRYDLDFLLRFGFGILGGEILTLPRLGIWSFHHGDEQEYRGGPPAFWEMVEGNPVTGAVLQRLTERLDGGVVLKKGWFPTRFHSYAANLDQVLYASARWPARVCRDLRRGMGAYLSDPPSTTRAPLYRLPGARTTLRAVGTMAAARLRMAARRLLRHEDWNVGVVRTPIHGFLTSGTSGEAEWMDDPGRNRFVADPFGVETGGGTFVLCEIMDYCDPPGRVGVTALPSEGPPKRPRSCLTGRGHLSYPFVFEHEGALYCVPESSDQRRVVLFRASSPDDAWEPVATLLEDVAAVDPTIFSYEDRWWLACTDADEGSTLALHLWYSDALDGPWLEHAGNPVKIDVRSARPGGTPFIHEGELYRPAQDCSRENGGRILIQRILQLTPEAFSEETVAQVEPDPHGPYPSGLHTLSAVGDVTLLDGKRLRTSPCKLVRELRDRVGSLVVGRRRPREEEWS